ncbi:MAG: NlpC/P60 family protein [Mycobacteriales bacterium]
MPAHRRSFRSRALILVAALLSALGAAGLTAVSASATTATACYLSSTTIVGPGSTTVFAGQILTSTGAPIRGVRAQLEQLVSGAWQPYYYVVTDSSGRAGLSVRPSVTMTVRLSLYPTTSYTGCSTGPRTLWVSTDAAVMTEAARHNGQPYVYGAAGPSSFDCSGYTQYVYRQFGRILPRTTAQQYAAVHHIPKSYAAQGDLIFFGSTPSGIYHMGIYAGGGYIWHSPSNGQTVKKQLIWTSAYYTGRL